MGGFRDLKEDFGTHLGKIWDGKHTPEVYFLALRCLFEIAGNLDTIAVEMREIRKDLSKRHFINEIQMHEMEPGHYPIPGTYPEKSGEDRKNFMRYKKHGFTGDVRGPCETCLLPFSDAVHKVL